ncbi:MAG: very short patch repair endonuclease [Treponema sp.]|nr:very short patch repair endonuclease [Treponema sp.]
MAKKRKARAASSAEESRSYTMSRVKGSDTKIEVALRKALWRSGLRYRKNHPHLPGKPDIALTKHKIAIFCDGEFWHGKNWQAVKAKLGARRDYWIKKIERNIERDGENERRLAALGWTVIRFWGKDIQKNLELCVAEVQEAILAAQAGAAYKDCPFDEAQSLSAEEAPDYL